MTLKTAFKTTRKSKVKTNMLHILFHFGKQITILQARDFGPFNGVGDYLRMYKIEQGVPFWYFIYIFSNLTPPVG